MSSNIIVFERQVLSLAIIEKELFQLYTEIAQKAEDVSAKTLLSYIATDSLKHSTILAAIFDEVNGSKAKESDCDVNIRYNKQLIETLTKDISKTETISQEELISLIDTLCNFEELLYNEYKKSFHLEYTQVTTGYKSQKDEEPELNIFNLIVGDEERHQKILMSLVILCDRKLSFKQDAPVVKYQSPDSWYVPPRGRRQ
ncbi:MAG: hypothetical protein CW716_07775 [Candidatus Bathyarchaeum sp.]|nr:MAG: hypothetical protein CW716_07775 [Candidatus Bathyarchaeum sp.]